MMKKYLIISLIIVLCVILFSCTSIRGNDEITNNTNNDAVNSENVGIKPTNNMCYIRLSTAKDSYDKDEKIQLLLYIGCDSYASLEHENYKIVFNTPNGIELIENNEVPLEDFPGERWYFQDNSSTNLWSKFSEPMVIEIDPLALQDIESGTIRAEIVGDSVELSDVSTFQAELYFNSTGNEVKFSIHSNDSIHEQRKLYFGC